MIPLETRTKTNLSRDDKEETGTMEHGTVSPSLDKSYTEFLR
jgi:hypothetical protein